MKKFMYFVALLFFSFALHYQITKVISGSADQLTAFWIVVDTLALISFQVIMIVGVGKESEEE